MDSYTQELNQIVDNFKEDLRGLRLGRATTALVENLPVDYYGSTSLLKQIAQINILDAKTIVISPWNKDDLVSVEKAINNSDLGLNPNNNGESVILKLPPMTEERRQELSKVVNHKAEETRVKIRQIREKENEKLNQLKKEGSLPEDDFFAQKKQIQQKIDEYNQQIEEIREKKESEIKSV